MYKFTTYIPAIVIALLYVLTGTLSLNLLHGHNIVNIGVFIPEGISLAFAIYFGKRVLPGIFIGQFILASLNINYTASFGIATINTIESYLAIYLFQKFKLHKELINVRDILGLGIMIVAILQPFSAFLSNLILILTENIKTQDYFLSSFSWWFGNVMGQLLYTPFLLLIFSNYKKINIREFLLYGFVVSFAIYILEIVISIQNVLLFLSITVPFTILIVAKKGMTYGTFTTVCGALVSAYTVYLGVGTFALSSIIDNTIN